MQEAQDFATVGHLYRGIEEGFARLVEKYGEASVFFGPAKVQASARYFGWPELITVTDLASATKAIETIVEEGGGARGDWTNAHYGKFLAVFDEYMRFKAQDPHFEPARPATAAFVRAPNDVDEAPLIADPLTAGVVERDPQGFVCSGTEVMENGKRPQGWAEDRDPYLLETNVPGIFVTGDVRRQPVKRCASAVGEGSMAVMFIHQHLATV